MEARESHDLSQAIPLTATVAADHTHEIKLTDISFKAGFQSLSLDTVMEITGLPLEKNKEAMEMMIECKKHIWKDENLSQALEEYFTITANLLLRTTKNVVQNDVNGILGSFIQESRSLEGRLRTHYTEIGPKKRNCRRWQSVARIFAVMPVIGPLYLTMFAGNGPFSLVSVLLSFVFLAIGWIGSSVASFYKSKEGALEVQEEVIGLVLMSIAFRNKDLSMQNPDFRKFEERQRKDRKIIMQRLSELQESASPGWSIKPIEWGG